MTKQLINIYLSSGGYGGSAQSFYIASPTSQLNSIMFTEGTNYGCNWQSQQPINEVVNFNFGVQVLSNGVWGTNDFYNGGTFINDNDIISAVANYVNGWHSCNDNGHVLSALVNTSNSNSSNQFVISVQEGSGTNWANVVNELANWSFNTYAIWVQRSDDFEESVPFCQCQGTVDTWINQYTATADIFSSLWFGGSADGCYGNQSDLYYYPGAQDSSCNGGYSALGLFDIADANGWGAIEPQQYNQSINNVYDTNNGQYYQLEPNAVQWANIINYGYQVRGYEPYLLVTMTQVLACEQYPSCPGTDNSGATAWGQMWDALASGNNYVAGDEITNGMDIFNSDTDIGWL